MITPTIQLNNGVSIPQLGLGVFRSGAGASTINAVQWALDAGWRHIDTAAIYGNEREVGHAIRESGVPREEIFVTTKLWNDDQGYQVALAAFERSLAKLGLETVDLYLLHWPVPGRRLDSWRALEELYHAGRVRAIGVSNFTIRHLDQLCARAEVIPAVNQVELHPFLQQPGLVAHCRALGIAVSAYSPLTKGRRLDHPRLREIAAQLGRSPAQILIRWSLEKGFITLPKSASQARILENGATLEWSLEAETIEALDALEENLRTAWDPSDVD